jgi:hydrogenase maturation protein HypF
MFLHRLRAEAPPLARIDAVEIQPLDDELNATDFSIRISPEGEAHTAIVADAATCPACLAEIRDPENRRHGYAFTNCTHCGPRLSIIERIPYDRANTSMAVFDMCAACQAEYENPADRRFHAQPNACANCGPRLWLEATGTTDWGLGTGKDPIDTARQLLRAGRVVAIKGIGGFHLACDASNADAVARLRQRKQRAEKPFALMACDVEIVRRYCAVSDADEERLGGSAAPIVLLRADGPEQIATGIAPGHATYGFMLPYSPLHHLLMDGLDAPIVLTSGNRSGAPQCIDNDEARSRLGDPENPVADALLLHDRVIVNRVDDSVVREIAGKPAVLRRARGYAPEPLRPPAGFAAAPDVLAFGGELKNTICLLRDGEATVSQHLGDLENAAANNAYRQTLALYRQLFEQHPQVLAIDSHPEYLPSKIGREWATETDIRLVTVQHHHAHIAACMADNGLDIDAPPVLGIALDGTGYGDDGTIWGGEFLLADYRGYQRLAALASVPMPGGAQSVRQPWRMAYAHLARCFDWSRLAHTHADLAYFRAVADKPLATLDGMMQSGFNSPLTSSCGRLFDAVAAVLGLRQTISYEGQAAIELEAGVDTRALLDGQGYAFAMADQDGLPRLEPKPMWEALLADLLAGMPPGVIAARFHVGLAQAIAQMIEHLAARHGNGWHGRIALSGGVFQNTVLTELLNRRLEAMGLTVLRHARVPANDGGLSLGQAAIAAAQLMNPEDKKSCV